MESVKIMLQDRERITLVGGWFEIVILVPVVYSMRNWMVPRILQNLFGSPRKETSRKWYVGSNPHQATVANEGLVWDPVVKTSYSWWSL